jgi:hypothetical protein
MMRCHGVCAPPLAKAVGGSLPRLIADRESKIKRRIKSRTRSHRAVHDAQAHVCCCGDADPRKEDQQGAVLVFARFWKQRTGPYPEELIFDSRLTSYARLNELMSETVHN